MSAPSKVIELVERFNDNLDSYKRGNYNETKLRIEYLNPFFEALGWDVQNKQGYAEAYKDVVHEDTIKVAGATKAPDYCFRIGGTRKFFLEAKKPSVYIKEAIHPAYQLRRYAWSAKLPLSILTDFEEFAIYDCRIKPVKNDKPSKARIKYMPFKEYPDRWEEIVSIFSREAILKGSFDKYSESNKRKRGTAEVDDAFLNEIESWRTLLAKNFALRNPRLSNRQLNEIVQKTVDRIIFLRICEDRGIEDYGQLMSLQNGTNIYSRLCKIYIRADDKYNSGLFYFSFEKGRQEPDRLSLELNLDDKVLKDIFNRLYYPDSPYEFSVLPADILGQIYEQFLGKVIRLTSGHRAIVEEKPEVRKAGGVYYTPTYIVEYIVKNTVGKLLEKKTPKQAEKLKILDPACGSGSFLLGAYQYLLDWYLKQYSEKNPEKQSKGKNPKICETNKGEWKLTTGEKKRILLNNIYGVDIDTQAVEVTKLSLLLRVLESETEQSLQSQLKLFHERALPDLGNNIKCGNSLIGSDYYIGKQTTMFDEEEMFKVNAFDWEKEFVEIMKVGGFDVVIGNPPYGANFIRNELDYIRKKYHTAQGELDSYSLFVEKSLTVASTGGLYSMIIPDTWLTLINSSKLRKWMLKNFSLIEIAALNAHVFPAVTVDPLILVVRNKMPAQNNSVSIRIAPKKQHLNDISCLKVNKGYKQIKWLGDESAKIKIFITEEVDVIADKLRNNSIILGDIVEYKAGCKPYEVGKGIPPQTKTILSKKPFTSHTQIASDWKKLIRGNDIQKFQIGIKKPEWIKHGKWLAAPRNPQIFFGKRILIQAIRNPSLKKRIVAAFASKEMIARINVYTLKTKSDIKLNYYYILGILNSTLMNWFLTKDYGLHTYIITGILQLPIRKIDFSDSKDKSRHEKMVKLVDRMLELNKKASKTKSSHDKTVLQRQIEATDQQIDQLVYELYGLTDKEIKVVEEG